MGLPAVHTSTDVSSHWQGSFFLFAITVPPAQGTLILPLWENTYFRPREGGGIVASAQVKGNEICSGGLRCNLAVFFLSFFSLPLPAQPMREW